MYIMSDFTFHLINCILIGVPTLIFGSIIYIGSRNDRLAKEENERIEQENIERAKEKRKPKVIYKPVPKAVPKVSTLADLEIITVKHREMFSDEL